MIDELFNDYEKFVAFFKKNDCKELRDRLLKTDKLRYWYCRNIKDSEEFWSKITESKWAWWYCKDVEDREEVRKHIKDGYKC